MLIPHQCQCQYSWQIGCQNHTHSGNSLLQLEQPSCLWWTQWETYARLALWHFVRDCVWHSLWCPYTHNCHVKPTIPVRVALCASYVARFNFWSFKDHNIVWSLNGNAALAVSRSGIRVLGKVGQSSGWRLHQCQINQVLTVFPLGRAE